MLKVKQLQLQRLVYYHRWIFKILLHWPQWRNQHCQQPPNNQVHNCRMQLLCYVSFFIEIRFPFYYFIAKENHPREFLVSKLNSKNFFSFFSCFKWNFQKLWEQDEECRVYNLNKTKNGKANIKVKTCLYLGLLGKTASTGEIFLLKTCESDNDKFLLCIFYVFSFTMLSFLHKQHFYTMFDCCFYISILFSLLHERFLFSRFPFLLFRKSLVLFFQQS